jgi:peptidase C39-like protein
LSALRRFVLTAAAALAAAAVSPSLHAQSIPSSALVLDVPYLPQTEALCGGAAIAMVMRYWGASGVYAETFADLVDSEAGGIRGSQIIRALEGRGFATVAIEGDVSRVQELLARRRPPIALIEDRPGGFHYVVIVGWGAGRVIFHDPARSPFRIVDAEAFTRAWSASRFWTLVAEPKSTTSSTATSDTVPSPLPMKAAAVEASPVCRSLVEEGIRLAGSDLAGAQHVLEIAAADCPQDPAPWRELAGVRALRGEWTEAARDAARALDREPTDGHSTRILASALFLLERDVDALDAWNRLGVPVVDLADVRGLERTRYAVAADALDLEPNTLLTVRKLARARRRLEALPSLMGSRLTYEPREDDRAKVVASVLERPMFPSGLVALAAAGLHAATDRELAVRVASPTGGGELWTAAWRWWERRPRVALGIAAPSPFGGIWSLDASVETQAYGTSGSEISERRHGANLTISDWTSGVSRVKLGVAVDRWTDGTTASLLSGVELAFADGLVRASLDGSIVAGGHRTATATVAADWRSSESRVGSVWSARTGFSAVGSEAPLALQPGAGTGQGRDVLLRAHHLLHDGVIRGVFGRRLAFAGAEWNYWSRPVSKTLRLAPALFVDTARAYSVPVFGDPRLHLDVGGGVRVAVPGAGVLRADFAHGLRDGSNAWSFGWTP